MVFKSAIDAAKSHLGAEFASSNQHKSLLSVGRIEYLKRHTGYYPAQLLVRAAQASMLYQADLQNIAASLISAKSDVDMCRVLRVQKERIRGTDAKGLVGAEDPIARASSCDTNI